MNTTKSELRFHNPSATQMEFLQNLCDILGPAATLTDSNGKQYICTPPPTNETGPRYTRSEAEFNQLKMSEAQEQETTPPVADVSGIQEELVNSFTTIFPELIEPDADTISIFRKKYQRFSSMKLDGNFLTALSDGKIDEIIDSIDFLELVSSEYDELCKVDNTFKVSNGDISNAIENHKRYLKYALHNCYLKFDQFRRNSEVKKRDITPLSIIENLNDMDTSVNEVGKPLFTEADPLVDPTPALFADDVILAHPEMNLNFIKDAVEKAGLKVKIIDIGDANVKLIPYDNVKDFVNRAVVVDSGKHLNPKWDLAWKRIAISNSKPELYNPGNIVRFLITDK